jgi:hypothetical protein
VGIVPIRAILIIFMVQLPRQGVVQERWRILNALDMSTCGEGNGGGEFKPVRKSRFRL